MQKAVRMRRCLAVAFVWLVGALPGCASTDSFGAGVHAYAHGRYPEALENLCAAEIDAAAWRGRDRARYALYRGLAHLALGDHAATLRWLGEAERALAANPLLLPGDDAGRLASAWAHLPNHEIP